MGFAERREAKKIEKIYNSELTFEAAVYYSEQEPFYGYHIVPIETKEGFMTGKYHLVSPEEAKQQWKEEQIREQIRAERQGTLKERIHFEPVPVEGLKYNNYQAARRYRAQDWTR